MEYGFLNSVARAGRAFRAVEGSKPSVEGKQLATYLLSDDPLGPDERRLLADLVLGEFRNSPEVREVGAAQSRVVEVVRTLRAALAEGQKKEAAKLAVAEKFGISRGTVENYEKMTIEREKEVASESKKAFPPN